MGSSAMIYITKFKKTGSGIQKLSWTITHVDTQQVDLISQLVLFLKYIRLFRL
jgi:hypothetical protein